MFFFELHLKYLTSEWFPFSVFVINFWEKVINFLYHFSQSGIFYCERNQCLFSCSVRCNVIFLILFLQLVKSQKINKLMPSLKSSQGDYSLKKTKTGSSWFRWNGKQIPQGEVTGILKIGMIWLLLYPILLLLSIQIYNKKAVLVVVIVVLNFKRPEYENFSWH